jgi:hypothetical protein
LLSTLRSLIARDPDYSPRTWTLEIRRRVLKGTLYDVLTSPFHEERSPSGEYIPLVRRRPSVRYGLCKIIARDSIALLFGEGRFPALDTTDAGAAGDGPEPAKQRELIANMLADAGIPQAMTDAAWKGVIGSVAVRMRVLKGRLFVDSLDTVYLLPEYDPMAPDVLTRVVEERKVPGSDLISAGYPARSPELPFGLEPSTTYWFRREWTTNEELWFAPLSITDKTNGKPYIRDNDRSVIHGLGFVPMVWIRNLPGGEDPDGGTTIPDEVISTGIEIDYLLSQNGRGLRYSLDPTLLLKEPAVGEGQIVKGAGNALVVSEKGDAKLLEIGGTASAAVLDWVKGLREFALETAHGNRSSPDKLGAAQSGRALELLMTPLIWLADDLRTSYGNGLIELFQMIARASKKYPVTLRDGTKIELDPTARVTLRWPPWFPPTLQDQQTEASTLSVLTQAGLMSRESAVREVADTHNIPDATAELARIAADQKADDARAAEQAAAIAATEVLPS